MTLRLSALSLLAVMAAAAAEPAATATPEQIRLCMIGASTTWYGEGDSFRQFLVARLPRVAFVGTHSAKHGYSHAGEGGNTTAAVLARLPEVPASPYYHLWCGLNDCNVPDEAAVQPRAIATAERLAVITEALLARPGTRAVLLGSLTPTTTDDPGKPYTPWRSRTAAATNAILQGWLGNRLPAGRVVWVDYVPTVLATPGWEGIFRLHPTRAGYEKLATVLADTLVRVCAVEDPSLVPRPAPGTGVRVDNLLDDSGLTTRAPVIAGWYTLSWEAAAASPGAVLVVDGAGTGEGAPDAARRRFPVTAAGRQECEVFTGYEGYGYTRARLTLRTEGCTLVRTLFEKRRPSGRASVYGTGSYLDTTTVPAPGEPLERDIHR